MLVLDIDRVCLFDSLMRLSHLTIHFWEVVWARQARPHLGLLPMLGSSPVLCQHPEKGLYAILEGMQHTILTSYNKNRTLGYNP